MFWCVASLYVFAGRCLYFTLSASSSRYSITRKTRWCISNLKELQIKLKTDDIITFRDWFINKLRSNCEDHSSI